ncbi:MAG: alpha/beta hydrolase [Burkholderiales bacterium]|nr:MAG: alpha/beta hydrolase [Burkholderiales bacterium]
MSPSSFRTADGVELAGLTLRPTGPAKAAVAMVHGFGEHVGRYAGLHRALLGAGCAIAAADLRGFGRSPGLRGHIDGWDDYRADAAAIVAQAAALAPDRPLFLFGHSMGGLIVLDHALHRPEGLAGVIASGPALVPAGPRRPLLELAARVLSRVAPRLGTELGLDPAGISSVPAEVEAYRSDPLVHGRATMRWGAEILRTMAETLARAGDFPRPLLLLHGADDPINAPEGSRAFHEACGHPDRALRLYPGCRHEVHHDIESKRFERDLQRWIAERSQRSAVPEPAMRRARPVAPRAAAGDDDPESAPLGGAAS